MRIGIFDPYLDDLGGGEKYMMSIAQILSNRHDVDVFWDRKQDLSELTERFSLNLTKVNIVKNIFDTKTPAFKRLLESIKYDVIILLSDGSLPFLLSRKTFIHFQQPFPNITATNVSSFKKNRISAFFVNSQFTKSFIDKEFDIDSYVLCPPIDIKSQDIDKENIILNVGRFRVRDVTTLASGKKEGVGDYKKQGTMVERFKEMCNNGLKGWKFIIGVSVNKNEEDIFEKFRLSAKNYPVEFLVNKNNDALWKTYSKAKIYWHASGYGEDLNAHPEFAEHFGISTVEAMGAGAVPVVINAGGQREIVKNKENGFLWDTLDQLQDYTFKLINDKDLFKQMSDSAKSAAKKYRSDLFSEKLFTLILK